MQTNRLRRYNSSLSSHVVFILLSLVLVSAQMFSSTYARYASNKTAVVAARVSEFDPKFSSLQQETYDSVNDTYWANFPNGETAPMTFTVTNGELPIKYDILITLDNESGEFEEWPASDMWITVDGVGYHEKIDERNYVFYPSETGYYELASGEKRQHVLDVEIVPYGETGRTGRTRDYRYNGTTITLRTVQTD